MIEFGVRPDEWQTIAPHWRAVMLAHQLNKADICPDCGLPLSVTTGEDYVYGFDDAPTCHACVAISQDAEARSGRKPQPGVRRTILPTRREDL